MICAFRSLVVCIQKKWNPAYNASISFIIMLLGHVSMSCASLQSLSASLAGLRRVWRRLSVPPWTLRQSVIPQENVSFAVQAPPPPVLPLCATGIPVTSILQVGEVAELSDFAVFWWHHIYTFVQEIIARILRWWCKIIDHARTSQQQGNGDLLQQSINGDGSLISWYCPQGLSVCRYLSLTTCTI